MPAYALGKAYEAMWADGIDIRQVPIGVSIDVQVTGNPWGGDYPNNCIFDQLTCTAAVYSGGLPRLWGNYKVEDRACQRKFLQAMGAVEADIKIANGGAGSRIVPNDPP